MALSDLSVENQRQAVRALGPADVSICVCAAEFKEQTHTSIMTVCQRERHSVTADTDRQLQVDFASITSITVVVNVSKQILTGHVNGMRSLTHIMP